MYDRRNKLSSQVEAEARNYFDNSIVAEDFMKIKVQNFRLKHLDLKIKIKIHKKKNRQADKFKRKN